MDYTAFHQLHELVKNGISEYIWKDKIRCSNGGNVFIIAMVKLQRRYIWRVHYNFLLAVLTWT